MRVRDAALFGLALLGATGAAGSRPPAEASDDPRLRANPEISERTLRARGGYVTGAYASVFGVRTVADRLRAAGLNAIVVDFKDDDGNVRHATKVPELLRAGRPPFRDARRMIADLHERGLYVIARVVCFKDRVLAFKRPDLAIRDARTGRPWVAPNGSRWLDPSNAEVRRILVAMMRELEGLGIDEVQFDYVRYPVGAEIGRPASSPPLDSRDHHRHVQQFLRDADEALSIPISVDVFGLTVFHQGDPTGIGQSIENIAPYVEVISPMLYSANFHRDFFRGPLSRRHYDIMQWGTANLRRRVGDRVVVRPYVQAFPFRAPGFGPQWLADVIQGARDGGADGFLFWNNRVQYATAFAALRVTSALRPTATPATVRGER